MNPCVPVVLVIACPALCVPTEVWQVAPDCRGKVTTRTTDRAVLLIPGLKIHPFRPALSTRPELHRWQEPDHELVKTLSRDSDVFAFGYAQTAPVDVVAGSTGLREAVAGLRRAGYTQVVLVGHSAGGVIARLFVEANPDSGVTKVVTVAAPHAGAGLADVMRRGYPKVQAPFVHSLSTEAYRARPAGPVDDKIEMACVVCKLRRFDGDGLVNTASQWPEECRKCGVPAVLAEVNHWEAMHSPASAKLIAELVREKLTRWNANEVEQAKKVLFGDRPERPALFRRR